MAGYTRDFLIEVAVHRYLCLGSEAQAQDRKICEVTYDKFGKDKFRDLACVTPQAIRDYKAYQKNV